MLRRTLIVSLSVVLLGFATQDASAFGHFFGCRGWCGGGGYGCGYAGYGYGYGYGGYAGWGYSGWGYGPSWGYAGYVASAPSAARTASPTGQIVSPAARTANRPANNAAVATADSAVLKIDVPADAKVIINNYQTTSVGEHRTYFSSGLQPGAHYRYQIRAEFVRDGKPANQELTVDLVAGQTRSVDFSKEAKPLQADPTMSAATTSDSSQR